MPGIMVQRSCVPINLKLITRLLTGRIRRMVIFLPNLIRFTAIWQDQSDDPVALALAKLLRVAIMHRMTDMYGPIPYSKVIDEQGSVSLNVPYDSAGSCLQANAEGT